MGITAPQILSGHVMHGRLFPKKNHFRYGIYYLALPLSRLNALPIAYNRPGIMSFYDADHGDGTTSLNDWARAILSSYTIETEGEIVLICMPRILGYAFNPVSFWLCHDKEGILKAVLCEVRNTFGERHTYLCAHADGRPIRVDEKMAAEKVFHVSPFLKREGHYSFRFDSRDDQFGVWIDYFDAEGKKQLVTSLAGHYQPMMRAACRRVFWRYPLVTFKAIFLIHYQALRLVLKKIRYIPKPDQRPETISRNNIIKKI